MIGMVHQVNQLPHAIPIGVQTENGVESVGFVVSAWQSVYGVMDFSVWATRPGEDVAYEVQHTELVGSILYWYPDEVDTAIAGVGKVEVKGTTGDMRKLSGFCETVVQPSSLAMTQDPPKVVIPWLEDIKESAEEAKKQADRAEEIANDITGGEVTGSVRFDKPQQLTDEQKAQARANIGAGTGSGSGDGTPGEDGGYYMPTVNDGILNWQPSKEDMPQAPSADVRGPKGDKGEAATIRVGTVTTLSPGSKATVRNSGTDTDAVFDFGIPRGADGEGGSGGGSGTPGEDGGYYMPTVSDGILSWEASKEDMPPAPSADVRGPKGDKGDPGEPGYTPQKGVDYFDGTPGTPGTSVTVKSVAQNTEDGGTSVVTFSDGKTLQVRNGKKGSPGDPGQPGYTPVKYLDYWTEADRKSMVNDVLAALPVYNGEVADA